MLTKVCTSCGIEKPLSEFHKNKSKTFGVHSECKICANERSRKWRKNNCEKNRTNCHEYRKINPYKKLASDIRYRKKNRAKILKSSREYHKKNRSKEREYARKRNNERRKTEPIYKLSCNMSKAIRTALKGNKNGWHWETLIGYTVTDLKKHIKKKFTKGMTWELFLKGKIEIDHKIPISAFNFSKPEHTDFKKCFSLKNLQPLWAKDNRSKGAKLEKPFQPSLLL